MSILSIFGYVKEEEMIELKSKLKKQKKFIIKQNEWIIDVLKNMSKNFLPYADHPLSMSECRDWTAYIGKQIKIAEDNIKHCED